MRLARDDLAAQAVAENRSLPMKLIVATPVTGPSSTSKIRSTRFCAARALRRHLRGEAAGAAIDFDDALHVGLDARGREHRTRRGLDFFFETLRRDARWPSKMTRLMIGFSITRTTRSVAALLDLHVGEQAGGEQGFERKVAPVSSNGRPVHEQVGRDRRGSMRWLPSTTMREMMPGAEAGLLAPGAVHDAASCAATIAPADAVSASALANQDRITYPSLYGPLAAVSFGRF